MANYAYLDGHKVVETDDVVVWGTHFERENRRVARSQVNGFTISTVFLGLNHAFGDGPAEWFETMVFGAGTLDEEYTRRYTTWEEAEDGHLKIVEVLQGRGLS